MEDRWVQKSLEGATAQVVGEYGIRILGNSARFLACLMDLTDNESSEMRVFSRNCDDELLAPLVEACREETSDALSNAAHRMLCLLRDERGISGERAGNVAWAITNGCAQAIGVSGVARPVSSQSAPRQSSVTSSQVTRTVDQPAFSVGQSASMGTQVAEGSLGAMSGGRAPSEMGDRSYTGYDYPSMPSNQMSQQPYQTSSQGYGGMPPQNNTQMAPPQGYVSYTPPAPRRSPALIIAAVLLAAVAGVVLALALSGNLGPRDSGTVNNESTTTSKSEKSDSETPTKVSDDEGEDEDKDEEPAETKDDSSTTETETKEETTETTPAEETPTTQTPTTETPTTTTTTETPTTTAPTTTETQPTASEPQHPGTGTVVSSYVLPESNSRYYSYDELAVYDNWTLYLARNEIYARHGRKFVNQDLQDYFNSQPWYSGYIEPDYFDEGVFNDCERQNVQTIKSIEESRGSIYLLPQSQR